MKISLIGSNCPRVLRPRGIIAGGEDEPYGQKSLPGWGVIGRVCKSPQVQDDGVCNKMVSSKAYPHFVYDTKVEEVFDAKKIMRVLESDFQMSVKNKPYSVEDAKTIKQIETGSKKKQDRHYKMPLPHETMCVPFLQQSTH